MMYVLLFIFGTIFGSLGSVLLSRLHEHTNWATWKGILFGFSRCPHCKNRLHAQHLIPLVSFFWQEGKCAFCKKPISWQYPLMEIASGLIFMFSYYLVFGGVGYGIAPSFVRLHLLFWTFTNWGLLLLIIQDIKTQDLHMPMWIFTTIWILVWQFIGALGNYQGAVIASLSFAAITALIYFGAKWYVSWKYRSNQEGFGQGDIYIGFSLGALIPFVEQFNSLSDTWLTHIELIITLLLLASFLGLFYALCMYLIDHQTNIHIQGKQKIIIPFFPSLIVAYRILLVFGSLIIPYLF